MDVITKQKAIADEVLSKLEAIDPFVIVAGGAPRDWWYGKEATDIDVFLHIPADRAQKHMKKQFSALGLNVVSVKTGEFLPDNYKMNPDLVAVFNVAGYDTPVQVMVMRTPTFTSVLPKFALSVCMAWYKDGKIRTDKHFDNSVKHKVIYRRNEVYNNEHQYVKKILGKFPEYKYYSSYQEFLETLI